ncbi:MAG: glycoside hydrolase family 65 protein [Gemmatimonadaceae bacterium]
MGGELSREGLDVLFAEHTRTALQDMTIRSAKDMSDLPFSPTPDPVWLLIEEGVDLAREREIESMFAIGNGYIGTRASIAEDSRFSHPSTFAAGVYVTDASPELGTRLAVLPNWFHAEIKVEDQRLSLEAGRVLDHRRFLDLRQGMLWREWRQRDPSGRVTRLIYLQLASLADRHIFLQSVTVTAENYAGKISLTTRPIPSGEIRMEAGQIEVEPAVVMRVSEIDVAIASASMLHRPGTSRTSTHEDRSEDGEERWSWETSLGEAVRLDHIITVFTSRDVVYPAKAALDHLATIRTCGFPTLVQAHVDAWYRKWNAAEVRIAGDEQAQRALRFACYHLIAAVNPTDEYVSISARGLTGEAYRGHVFWDTEIYMLPFYVFTDPLSARSLLMYRYHTLDAARRKAKEHGYEGALYAWESADTGDEVTPRRAIMPDGRVVTILTGEREHHISADIAYAVWQYWRVSGDDAFMLAAGAEILVETARFWASRAQVEPDGRAHIRQVIGPDEYHEMIDDNAYTNAMAIFNLERAADTIEILQREQVADWQRLCTNLDLAEKEPATWRALAGQLATGFDPATKLFEQFAGYFQLDEVDVVRQRASAMPIDAYLGPERVRRSKAIKQADVVALSAVLWDQWPVAVHEANFRYYEPRTAHGSSLSPALYALVAARLGDGALAQAYFRQAAEIDLANNMGSAAGGVHMGALGGLWQAAVNGAAGLRAREDGIALDPRLLPGWTEMAFPVQWRGRLLRLRLEADRRCIEVNVESGGELCLSVPEGPVCLARPGRRYVLRGDRSGWCSWEEVGQ